MINFNSKFKFQQVQNVIRKLESAQSLIFCYELHLEFNICFKALSFVIFFLTFSNRKCYITCSFYSFLPISKHFSLLEIFEFHFETIFFLLSPCLKTVLCI